MITEAQKKAKAKYRKKNTVSISITFYKNTEQELIDEISKKTNKSGYIKELIQKSIDENKNND